MDRSGPFQWHWVNHWKFPRCFSLNPIRWKNPNLILTKWTWRSRARIGIYPFPEILRRRRKWIVRIPRIQHYQISHIWQLQKHTSDKDAQEVQYLVNFQQPGKLGVTRPKVSLAHIQPRLNSWERARYDIILLLLEGYSLFCCNTRILVHFQAKFEDPNLFQKHTTTLIWNLNMI